MRDAELEAVFPNLRSTAYDVISPATPRYNCIAWAAGDDQRWWEPTHVGGCYWPPGVPKTFTLDSYLQAFQQQGYELCNTGALEPGYEKVAIYSDQNGLPTHAARQLPRGTWTSKLGKLVDIE